MPLSVGSAILSTTTGAGRRSTTSQWRWLIATSGRQMSLTSTGRTWSGTTPTPSPRPKKFQTHQKRPSAEKPPKLVGDDLIKSQRTQSHIGHSELFNEFLQNKAKRFAKQLASVVYQNKAHSKSQVDINIDMLLKKEVQTLLNFRQRPKCKSVL